MNRLVAIGQAQTPGPQRIQTEMEQAIVAAEKVQIIRAPQAGVVLRGIPGIDIGDIDQAQGRGIFHQEYA